VRLAWGGFHSRQCSSAVAHPARRLDPRVDRRRGRTRRPLDTTSMRAPPTLQLPRLGRLRRVSRTCRPCPGPAGPPPTTWPEPHRPCLPATGSPVSCARPRVASGQLGAPFRPHARPDASTRGRTCSEAAPASSPTRPRHAYRRPDRIRLLARPPAATSHRSPRDSRAWTDHGPPITRLLGSSAPRAPPLLPEPTAGEPRPVDGRRAGPIPRFGSCSSVPPQRHRPLRLPVRVAPDLPSERRGRGPAVPQPMGRRSGPASPRPDTRAEGARPRRTLASPLPYTPLDRQRPRSLPPRFPPHGR
jgi:hypothetical protein